MAVSSSEVRALGGVFLQALDVVICFFRGTFQKGHETVAAVVIVNRALLSLIPANNL